MLECPSDVPEDVTPLRATFGSLGETVELQKTERQKNIFFGVVPGEYISMFPFQLSLYYSSNYTNQFTFIAPPLTQTYKRVPANLMLGVTLRWTSIPSREE